MTQDNHIPPAILEEAMDWFLDLKARPDCRQTEQGFQEWLSRSPTHGRAWEQALKTWTLLGEVPPVYEHVWRREPAATVVSLRSRRPWKRWTAGAITALAASAIVLLAGPSLLIRLRADHMTQTAESRTVKLEDGTVIEMAGDSAIATEITASVRRVTLLSGEAFFDVAHDASRPFTVDAGGVAVAVLGTAFDVQMANDTTTVELARGVVAISYAGPEHRENFELAPGEMAAVDRRTGDVIRDTIAPEDIAAWRGGKLFVNDVSVAAAVERLQRYHPAWISIPDPALAARRVTGLYDLKNPDQALAALVKPFGGNVREVTSYGRILTRF
ncbi:FecR family protein [Pararhizobium sp. O133]|uniref:FecR family protein n=1 Tax=Pararhizobium sp. O133 TaxID=3449278 RepID=UPI003F683154